MNTVDLNTIGTDYNIIDKKGQLIKMIKLVQYEDILAHALGEYSEEFYDSYEEYISLSKAKFSGYPEDPFDVLWYTTTEKDYSIMDIADKAISRNASFVIVEYLEEEDLTV